MPLDWAVPTLGRKYPLKWVSTAVQRGTWGRRVMNLCTSWITAFVNGMFLRSSYVTQLPALTVLPISSCTFSGRNKEWGCIPARKPTPPPDLILVKKMCFSGVGRKRSLKTPEAHFGSLGISSSAGWPTAAWWPWSLCPP